MNLSFFDCNVRIGRGNTPLKQTPESRADVPNLIDETEYFGIQDALVYHRIAQEGSTHLGNKILMEAIDGHPQLHPCWVVSPIVLREEDEPENLLAAMKDQGVKAVRLSPGAAGFAAYPVAEWMIGKLFKALAKDRVPVFCRLTGLAGDVNASLVKLDELCSTYPELSLVTGGWSFPYAAYPLLERHSNLYVDASMLSRHGAVESLCKLCGADRLLFGTWFGTAPFPCAGASISVVTTADISEEDKRKIAGDNLRRLLGLRSADRGPEKRYSSAFISPLREGRAITEEVVVDAHAHNGIDEGLIPDTGPDGMVAAMDRLGIDVACFSCSQGITGADVPVMNDLMVRTVQAHPDRFVGYTRVDPNYPDEMRAELELRYEQAGIKHVKMHPVGQQYPLTGEGYEPGWEFARQHKSVVLVHSSAGSDLCRPRVFAEVADKHPDIPIIIGHSGNDNDGYKEAVEAAQERPNLWLETSGWCMTSLGVLEYVVERIGADRVLFGTDFAFIGIPFQLGAIAYAKISDEDKRKVMGLNAVKLFELDLPR